MNEIQKIQSEMAVNTGKYEDTRISNVAKKYYQHLKYVDFVPKTDSEKRSKAYYTLTERELQDITEKTDMNRLATFGLTIHECGLASIDNPSHPYNIAKMCLHKLFVSTKHFGKKSDDEAQKIISYYLQELQDIQLWKIAFACRIRLTEREFPTISELLELVHYL